MLKGISIVVCTFNRCDLLYRTLLSLGNQTLDKDCYEVIVVDNASTDDMKSVISSFLNEKNFRYIYEEKQGLSHSRNTGFLNSKAEYVGYLDDDAKASKNWLSEALEVIINKKPDIFGGPIYPYYLNKKPEWFKDEYEIRMTSKSSRFLRRGEYISGSNIFFKKELLLKLGGFNTKMGMKGKNLSYHEETDLMIKAWENNPSLKVYYSLPLKVEHLVSEKKMHISFYFKSCYFSGKEYTKINKKYNKKVSWVKVKSLMLMFISLIRIVRCFIKGIFRDKKRYKYYQNYLRENIGKYIFGFGMLIGNLNPRF